MRKVQAAGKNIDILFDEATISDRVLTMAQEIKKAGMSSLLVVSILKGSFIFAADLLRALHNAGLDPEVEFISLSSYGTGTKSSGEIRIVRDIESNVTGRSVLLLDDILESGRTLAFAKDLLIARGAAEVKACVLLDKRDKRVVDVDADFVGFECPDQFVVGYGMDMAHAFRQLPFVGVIAG